MRRAKIVCTLGPASGSVTMVRKLIKAGMDVARLNFSHGTYEFHAQMIDIVRSQAEKLGRPVAVLQDLQGPKLRVGEIPEPLILRAGQDFTLTPERNIAKQTKVTIAAPKLYEDVCKGETILLDDGRIRLKVQRVRGRDIHCKVHVGGLLTSHKGINLPESTLSLPSLTAKDRRDLKFGIKHDIDMVALSFVRTDRDIKAARRILDKADEDIHIIAKMEKPQAVQNLASILSAADAIMVARGDLGVETPAEQVPLLQKRMIRSARQVGKPVITATQMLESMIHSPQPTRAEASDVANAVLDGTDAVMLSAETAAGDYPLESVTIMDRIIRSTETSSAFRLAMKRSRIRQSESVPDAIGIAAEKAAKSVGAKLITVFTQTGGSATLVSKLRPKTQVIAFTPIPRVQRRLNLSWGVEPMDIDLYESIDAMIDAVSARLKRGRKVKRGDIIVFTAGTPVGRRGTTNFMKIHRVE